MSAAPTAVHGWPHVALPAEGGDGPALVMLHGTGGGEREMADLGRTLLPGAAVLAPRGRVDESGMARYFARDPADPFRFPDLAERTDDLAAFLRAAATEYGLAPKRLYAVGYSNGANAATSLMLRHPGLLAGAVLLRGLLPAPAPEGLDLHGAAVLVLAGREDELIPPEGADRLVAALRDHGAAVEERWLAAGHRLTPEDLTLAREWLAARGHRPA